MAYPIKINKKDIPIIEPDSKQKKNRKEIDWDIPETDSYSEYSIWAGQDNNMKYKSKEQLDKETKFPLLTHDDYNLVIAEITMETQNKYMAKPDEKTGITPQEKIVKVVFEVLSYKDGSIAYNEDKEDAKGAKVFFTGRPESMGFMKDGTPSKTRCLIAYSTGQDVNGELELESWESLIGKTIFAEIGLHTTGKGQKRNKVLRLISPRQERVKPEEKPEVKKEEKPKPSKKPS